MFQRKINVLDNGEKSNAASQDQDHIVPAFIKQFNVSQGTHNQETAQFILMHKAKNESP
jgi:hypothetical protein